MLTTFNPAPERSLDNPYLSLGKSFAIEKIFSSESLKGIGLKGLSTDDLGHSPSRIF